VIAHLVLFKFKAGVDRNDDRTGRVVVAMQRLPGCIAQIRAWEHGYNETPDALAWDYGLRATFDHRDDMLAYFEHPDHMAVLQQWEEIADLVFCDFPLQ
jgi:hypothetical protein